MSVTAKHHDLELDPHRIAVITLDMAEKSTNVLSSESIQELIDTVSRLGALSDVKGLLIRSGKPKQFIAGANIDEILSITDPREAADKARIGQSLMQAIEDLPFPSVAAIDGPCLGGGLELALACTYRVAGDGSQVRLALPEVRLGIIPGFGGTQRLPKVVGFLPSLDLIVSGKTLNSKRARKVGLVDDVAPSPILDDVALKWLAKGKKRKRSAKTSGLERIIAKTSFLRRIIFQKARKKVLASTSGFYPAPITALDTLEETFGEKEANGYEVEARKVGEMIATPVSKALIQIFLDTEEIRREKRDADPLPVAKVGVIGAGVMGAGIARLLTTKNKMVRLREISTELLAKGMKTIFDLNRKDLKRRRLDKRQFEARMALVAPTVDWTGFGRADCVIEAVVEKMEIKKEVFSQLGERTRKEAVLATNTSALSISEIATAVKHPERVVGLHFFNPVHRMPLIEVVKGEKTSEQTIATSVDLALGLGKTPIVVADRPGFFVNRVLGLYLNEAMIAAEQGIAIDEIDKALKAFGMPMGPFELMDEVGLDVAQKVGDHLSSSLPHFPKASPLLGAICKDGRLGKKGGKGFYIHSKKGKKLDQAHIDKCIKTLTEERNFTMATDQYDELVDRMVLLMVNEAARCLEEGVVSSVRDVNIGMVFGIGFAPFRGGLFAYAINRGIQDIFQRLESLAAKYGDHFKPVGRLRSLDQASDKPPTPPSPPTPEKKKKEEETQEEVQLSFADKDDKNNGHS